MLEKTVWRLWQLQKKKCFYKKHYVYERTWGNRLRRRLLLTKDHFIPKFWNGPDDWRNYVIACKPCNKKKGSEFPQPDDWLDFFALQEEVRSKEGLYPIVFPSPVSTEVQMKQNLFRVQYGRCFYCKNTLKHKTRDVRRGKTRFRYSCFVPQSRNGPKDWRNTVVVCSSCYDVYKDTVPTKRYWPVFLDNQERARTLFYDRKNSHHYWITPSGKQKQNKIRQSHLERKKRLKIKRSSKKRNRRKH